MGDAHVIEELGLVVGVESYVGLEFNHECLRDEEVWHVLLS